jgi:hypothetical protein
MALGNSLGKMLMFRMLIYAFEETGILGFGFYGHQMIENFTGSFTIPNSIY